MSEHRKNLFEKLVKWLPIILMLLGMIGGYFTMKFTLESDHAMLLEHDKDNKDFDQRISRLEGALHSYRRTR